MALFDQNLALDADIKTGDITTQAVRYQFKANFLTIKYKPVGLVEKADDLFVIEAEGAQKDGCRKFSSAIYTDIDAILMIKLEVQP